MTELNAYRVNTPPLIKAAAFTSLTETEIRTMRNFLLPNDPAILANEVFFLGQPGTGARDIEGDDYKRLEALPASTGAGAMNTNRRTVDKQLVQQPNGSLKTIDTPKAGVTVYWNNGGSVQQKVVVAL